MVRLNTLAALAVLIGAGMGAAPAAAGPVQYVKECTIHGAGWFYIPGTDVCVNPDTGQTAKQTAGGTVYGETEVSKNAKDALEGVALNLSLQNATVDPGKTFGLSVNVGTFAGQSAIGLSGAYRTDSGVTLNGAAGLGLGRGTIGGRLGANISW